MADDDDWKALEAAFAEIVGLEGPERERVIAAFERSRPELGPELRRLVAADARDDAWLERPIASAAEAFGASAEDPWLGRRLGVWTIERRIASGGMGAVFLAHRTDEQYDQAVALKLMTAQLLARDAVSRFRAERQILASLDHPNIARLIDGGSTDENLPYLVMEYVDGKPIDVYCDALGLGIEARLELFAKVCLAVDYAHRKLVVHRDLKPSNILVDGRGEPRLLDFGIAKLLDADAYSMTMLVTRAGARTMTPYYASPEQVRGEPVSIASDVYSLGVLLFRLLTGLGPYESDDSPLGIERAIVESVPRRPSTAVSSRRTGDTQGVSRTVPPARLRRLLQGDLDNIVLRTLQKDPERRYATARQLADDVRNFLEHRPVIARADSLGYRLAKFARRNRWPIAVAAGFVATVASLTAFYTVQLARERDRAELEAALAAEATRFLTEMYSEADPATSLGEPLSARELLDRGAARVADELGDQPELQAELMITIAQSYRNMGENRAAREYLEPALPRVEASLGRDDPSVLELRHILGTSVTYVGEAAAARPLHEANLAAWRARNGPRSPEYARELKQLAVVDQALGDYASAERGYLDAIRIQRELGEPGLGELARTLLEYGTLLRTLDRPREEEALLLEALAIQERRVGTRHPDYVGVINNVGNLYFQLGELERARQYMEEHVRLQRELTGEDGVPYGVALLNYATLLLAEGDTEESLRLNEEVLRIYARGYGRDSLPYAYLLENQANVLMELERYEEAESIFREVLGTIEALYGADHQEYAFTQANFGTLLERMGKLDESVRMLRAAVATNARVYGNEHTQTAIAKIKLAIALRKAGELDEAVGVAEEALAAARVAFPGPHLRRVNALRTLADVHRDRGEYAPADALYLEAMAMAPDIERASVDETVSAELGYAESLIAQDRADEAEPMLRARDAALAGLGDAYADERREIAELLRSVAESR